MENTDEVMIEKNDEFLETQAHGGALKRTKKNEHPPVEYEPSLESKALVSEAKKELSEEDGITLDTLSKLIGKDGLKLEEACAIANVEFEVLKKKVELHPIIGKVITIKQNEYKHMLLKRLAIRARSGDDKVAQWLLETRFPNEFSTGKRAQTGPEGIDMLAQAISFIQTSGDSVPVVRKQTTILNIRRAGTEATTEVEKLKAFLN